jgi:hypothetical protein
MDLARTYLRWEDFPRALSCLEAANDLNRKNPQGFGIREGLAVATAEVYLVIAENSTGADRQAWLKKAEQACDAAIKTSRSGIYILPEALLLRGRHNWLTGKKSAALKDWQHSLEQSGKLKNWHMQGRAHLEIGQRLADRTHLETAEQILAEIGAEWDLARARKSLNSPDLTGY